MGIKGPMPATTKARDQAPAGADANTRMARPQPPFGLGARLWWPTDDPARPDSWALFRAQAVFATVPAQASLRIYAQDAYHLWINGIWVNSGPCSSAPPVIYWDHWDVTRFLQPGVNWIAVKVHHLGLGRVESRGGGLCCALGVDTEETPRTLLDRKEQWQCRMARAHETPSIRNVGGTGYAERYRLKADEDGWQQSAVPGEGWHTPRESVRIQDEWWRPRPIPALVTRRREPHQVQRQEHSLLVDFGEMVSGRPEIRGSFPAAGSLKVAYIEALGSGWAATGGEEAMYADEVTGPAGPFVWQSFDVRTFRYLRLTGPAAVEHVALTSVAYPLRGLGAFSCSDTQLNRLWEISDRTLRLCISDVYLDCPHRDRAQWMDSFVSARIALGLYGVQALTTKCLIQHGLCSMRGRRMLSPSINGEVWLPDYAFVQVMFALWYFHSSGDHQTLRELLPGIETIIGAARAEAGADGLLGDIVEPDSLLYLDNTFELNKQGRSAGLNALYLGALRAGAEIAHHLGEPALESQWHAQAGHLQQAIRAFAHPKYPGCYVDALPDVRKRYLNLNFSCELGRWYGSGAVARTFLYSAAGGPLHMDCAVYAGLRVRFAGKTIDLPGNPQWSQQPIYTPARVTLDLKPGWNEVEFAVQANPLNWDLYLGLADGSLPSVSASRSAQDPDSFLLRAIDWDSGAPDGAEQRARARLWTTPELSQATHGYLGYCHPDVDPGRPGDAGIPGAPLLSVEKYVRAYASVRVPFFCRATSDSTELENWVLPCNTPWTAFFLLAALFRHSHGREALAWMRRAWGSMLQHDATTCWEEWADRSSLCHAWGAAPAYFFQHEILGVKHEWLWQGVLVVRPNLFDLEWAQGHVAIGGDTQANIGVCLRRTGAGTQVDIDPPPGLRVRLDLSCLTNPQVGRGAELERLADGELAAIFDC